MNKMSYNKDITFNGGAFMNRAKQLMQKAYRNSANIDPTTVPAPVALKEKKVEEAIMKLKPTAMHTEALIEDSASVIVRPVMTRHNSSLTTNTPVAQIAREDLAIEKYGVNSWKSNFNIYNKDIVDFVRNFSSSNQLSGGKAITKSQMLEVMLDVMYYDLDIRPIGFDSPNDFREYLKEKMRLN